MYDRSASPASYDRGSSPSLRPGVPDMDWNWLRPSSSPRERGAALWPPSGTAGGHHAGVAAGAGAGSGPGGGGGGRALVGFARATGDNSLVRAWGRRRRGGGRGRAGRRGRGCKGLLVGS